MLGNILNNAQKASTSTSAASHRIQQPAPVVPTNAAAGPLFFVSTAQLQSHNQVDLMPFSSSVGQDENFEKVCMFLNDDNNGIIGIYGMGGVGKTTLMRRVHNDFLVKCNFDVIIWIVVSKEVDERSIQRDILAKLGLPSSQDETQYGQAIKIYNKLLMMKFVLLIDDIWKPLDMVENLGIPTPTQVNKSKIVFTTRSKEVSAQMHPHKEVKIVGLEWKKAWILFQQNVGGKALNSNPRIRVLAEQVAKECGGLPLALKVIGRAMASKCTPQQWENALTTLRKSPSEISGTKDNLFSRLKLSYDALPNPTIKECFLYCCLFPEDFLINKENLVDYWVGEGFLGSDENLIMAQNRGIDYINTLIASFLLEENNKKSVKMHDVIRDMAIWIVSVHGEQKPKFFVHPSFGLSKLQTADRWREAERAFVWTLEDLPQVNSQCHILTLLTQSSNGEIESLNGIFNSTPLLRVLGLNGFRHEALPAAMKKLVELRYLRIKSQYSLSLPSWMGNLTKLETLDLSSTQIRELPNTIGQLTELRHLNLANCQHLKTLPAELGNCCKLEMLNLRFANLEMLPTTVGKLSDLRYLSLSFTRIKTLPKEFWDLNNLEDLYFCGDNTMRFTAFELCKLEGMQSLNHVDISVNGLPNLGRLSNCLRGLWVDYCRSTLEICVDELWMNLLQLFGNMDRLLWMCIDKWPVEKIEASVSSNINTNNTCFSSLDELHFEKCANLSAIVLDELSLVNLQELCIMKCDRLEHIFGLQRLPRLESLSLVGCHKIEQVISENIGGTGRENICFPSLTYMLIESLHEMKSICSDSVSFPSLSICFLKDCPMLEQLPLGLMNGNRTPVKYSIYGSKEWWNGLKWQDDSFRSFLQPFFDFPHFRREIRPCTCLAEVLGP